MRYRTMRVSNIEEFLQYGIMMPRRLHSLMVSKTLPNKDIPDLIEAVQYLVVLESEAA